MSLLSAEVVEAALRRKAEARAAGISAPVEAVFVTVGRQPEYIHATLRSFLESDPAAALLLPVKLMVGGTDTAYVRAYEAQGIARIFAMTEQEVARMNGFPVPEGKRTHYRYNTNYLRALTLERDAAKGLLIFEDDLRFAAGWLRKMMETLQEIAAAGRDDFLLTLYSPLPYPGEAVIDAVPPKYFYGNQGLYYPPHLLKKATVFFRLMGVERYGLPGDVAVGAFCEESEIPLLRTRHSLIQHEGVVTTGLSPSGSPQHRSPTFIE